MPEQPLLACDLLIFDLDGTLIDSETDLAGAINASLAALGRSPLPQPTIVSFIGEGAALLVERSLVATGGSTPELLEQTLSFFITYYRQHLLDATCLYPGVMAALQEIHLAASHLPMAVLTNKPVRPSRSICDGLGISRFFFANYGGDSFPTKKPDPAGLRTVMQEAALLLQRAPDPQRTVLVGDSHVDIETARAAGVRSLGCTYGLSPESLRASNPDALAHSPMEWLDALRHMLSSPR